MFLTLSFRNGAKFGPYYSIENEIILTTSKMSKIYTLHVPVLSIVKHFIVDTLKLGTIETVLVSGLIIRDDLAHSFTGTLDSVLTNKVGCLP